LGVNRTGREGILRDINTYEYRVRHSLTSKFYFLAEAGISQPILHDNKGFEAQPTYHGFGRQVTDSSQGSKTQVKWSYPALPFLTLRGKTHAYKSYNTNS